MPLQRERIDRLLEQIKSEYLEMPDLRLTPAQAQRMWGVDSDICEALLGALADAKFLDRTRDGSFVRYGGVTLSRYWQRSA